MKLKDKINISIAALFPLLAIAHSAAAAANVPDLTQVKTVRDLSSVALQVLNIAMSTIYVLFILGLLFLGFRYINALRTGDKAVEEYKKIFIGAVVGMVVLTTLWGLVGIIAKTLGISGIGIPQLTVTGGV